MARKASPWDFGAPDKALLLKDGCWRRLLMAVWCSVLYLANLNSLNCCVCEDEVFECRKLKRRDNKVLQKWHWLTLTTCTLENKCFRRNTALKNVTLMMFWAFNQSTFFFCWTKWDARQDVYTDLSMHWNLVECKPSKSS